MNQKNVVVKIHGSCNQNPHGEMGVSYVIENLNGDTEMYYEYIDEKYGNSLNVAEYRALNKALERLIELNLMRSPILIQTTSSTIHLNYLGYSRPKKGYYLGEALCAARNIKRFHDLSIIKIDRRDNMEAINLLNSASVNNK